MNTGIIKDERSSWLREDSNHQILIEGHFLLSKGHQAMETRRTEMLRFIPALSVYVL